MRRSAGWGWRIPGSQKRDLRPTELGHPAWLRATAKESFMSELFNDENQIDHERLSTAELINLARSTALIHERDMS